MLANIKWPATVLFVIGFVLIVIGGGHKTNPIAVIGFGFCTLAVVPMVLAGLYYGARSLFGKADQ